MSSRLKRASALALTAVLLCLPVSAEAAGGRSGPQKPKRPLCTKKRTKRCVRAPKSAVRPKTHGQQGGPNAVVPDPVDGGLGGPGYNREESAISWARSLRGNTSYAWWCERFAENAFNTSGRFGSAWIAAQRLGLRSGWAPRGALVFFRPHSTNKGYGHVGISLGGTRMISALASVQETDINASPYWRSLYAGWAPAPAAWPGRNIVPTPPPDNTTPVTPPTTTTTTPTPTPAPTGGGGTTTPAVDRAAVVSYDQMRPGAPHAGYFNNAWQPFVAQSNTITQLAATVGTGGQPAGQAVPYSLTLRLCASQPDVNGNCARVAEARATIVNYGASIADIGDVAVNKGATYWVEWFQPPPANGGTWVTYWWGGGSTISSSDTMQAFVKGYNR